MFTYYEDMKGDTKINKMSKMGCFGVVLIDRAHKSSY